MLKTDEQRRWWFATHPEYSGGRKGARTGSQKWRKAFDHSAADRATRGKDEDQIQSVAQELELWRKAIEREKMGLEADPHTFLDVIPYRRFVMSPRQALRDLFRNTARDTVLVAVKGGKSKGSGEWVEVARSPLGLEHQSKMSGKPITTRDGKCYIEEYRVQGTNRAVDFDDFRDGKYYEYKGPYGNLLNNKNREFQHWCEAVHRNRRQAMDQVDAAKGLPVIWRVGENQVNAFKKILEDINGIAIVP